MITMKKLALTMSVALALGAIIPAKAQVSDVSFTVSPLAGYTMWNKELNLGHSPFWGVRAGFGIGPILEVRGSFERSFDLKGKLQSSGWNPLYTLGGKLEGSKVDIDRIGGEVKINLWSNTILTPYLTAGGGVLKFKYEHPITTGTYLRKEQLFGALGAGLKINLSRRVALALEAKNTIFNVDPTNLYAGANITTQKTLQNWGGSASLDVYLGGRQYGKDAVTRAYRSSFGDGFRGLKFVVEPGVAYINFNNDSQLRDTWLLGGSAGIDLGDLVGVRGFYYRETEDATKLNLKFGKTLEMYGGNFISRLNAGRGVTPYLTLGAGYMNVTNRYISKQGTEGDVKDGWFALGGAGLEIPLGRTFALYGSANAMLLESENPSLQTISSPSQVKVNWMLQTGLRINFGAKSRSGYQTYLAHTNDEIHRTRGEHLEEINTLRASYDHQLANLSAELAEAVARYDTMQVMKLAQEHANLEAEYTIAEQDARAINEAKTITSPSTVAMTEAQLERIIARVLAATNRGQTSSELSKLSDLDKILLIGAMRGGQLYPALQAQLAPQTQTNPSTEDRLEALISKIDALESRLDKKIEDNHTAMMEQQLRAQQAQTQALLQQSSRQSIIAPISNAPAVSIEGQTPEEFVVHKIDEQGEIESIHYKAQEPTLTFSKISVLAGANIGEASAPLVGVRPEWQISKSAFYLAPELIYGFGEGYALSANAILRPNWFKNASVSPYIGAGLGYSRFASASRFGINALIGIQFKQVLGGKLFADYTLRPGAHNHQIAVGYSFNF